MRYVKPELVAEVEFRAWTADGNLRHAAFRGLREDKPPREVVRETPKAKAQPQQREAHSETHPSGPHLLARPRRDQGRAGGLLYRGLAVHCALHRRAAAWRCCAGPEGIAGQTFFQKHAWKGLNPKIVLVNDPKDKDDEPLISINDLDGLIGLVQSAVLEIHPWGSTVADWERPT